MIHTEEKITVENFANGIVKRLLLLLLHHFVNNIVVNNIENRYRSITYIANLINKIRKPMLTTIAHFSKHQGTTRRILEVEELLPSSTAKWCLDRLLEWEFIQYQISVKNYQGRNFKIYSLTDSSRDTVEKIEAKHIKMYHKLCKIDPPSKIKAEEPELLLFRCLDCKETRWATYSSKIPNVCPECGSDKRSRILGEYRI